MTFAFLRFFGEDMVLVSLFPLYFSGSCKLESLFSSGIGFYFWHFLKLKLLRVYLLVNESHFLIYTLFDFLGDNNILIRFPSRVGNCSTFPTSSSACANLRSSTSPCSLNKMVLPRKNTNALTFAPCVRKLSAWFFLKLKSCSSVWGPNRISFTTTFAVLALISFCFFFC